MSEETNTPPAFFKAPAVIPTIEVFKAVLIYQRAKEAYDTAVGAFKRTKAGRLREADIPTYVEAERAFYRDAYEAWKTINAWADEVAVIHSTVYFESMVGSFLCFCKDHLEARDTGFIKAINDRIAVGGDDVSSLFAHPCNPDWVDVAFGARRYKAALRVGREGIESVDFYEINDGDRVSGFYDVSARMKYRGYEERLRHPLVKVSSAETPPSAAVAYADLIKEAAILASALSDFNNLHVGDFNHHKHRLDRIAHALTIRLGYFDEPNNPDAR